MKPVETLQSPCVGYCTTSLGTLSCGGCGRTQAEITLWAGAELARLPVWARLNAQAAGVLAEYLEIKDEAGLISFLRTQSILTDAPASVYYGLYRYITQCVKMPQNSLPWACLTLTPIGKAARVRGTLYSDVLSSFRATS